MSQTLSAVLDDETIDAFEAKVRGTIFRPADERYDEARAIYNGMIDRHPSLIVRCANVADVIASVTFAQEHGLEIAIRGGGHNGQGLAMVDDGLVIDLSAMTGVRVDPDARTVRVEGGATWADVDHATHAFGLATVSGIFSTTGVGGLTLGGGHGYLSRKYGLTIDNLLSADVVLADGRLVHASETEHPDLFWALRGGGGNFGVVTSFEFELHPVDTVIGGPLFWPLDDLEKTMEWYREWLPETPEDIYAFYLVGTVPPMEPFPEEIQGQNICGLTWSYTGPQEEFEDVIQEARDVAEPLFEGVGPMPYPVLQGMFDALPAGFQWYWKGDFVEELTDEAIAAHRQFAEVPAMSAMHLYPIDGAVNRVDPDETAWRERDATWSMVITGVSPDPDDRELITEWTRDYWAAVHPHTAGATHVNFMMDEGADRIQGTFGANYERLQAVKAEYDPENVFHVNQNVKPAT
jgi:FAD/FMN-containing dehydrogenase